MRCASSTSERKPPTSLMTAVGTRVQRYVRPPGNVSWLMRALAAWTTLAGVPDEHGLNQ